MSDHYQKNKYNESKIYLLFLDKKTYVTRELKLLLKIVDNSV